MLGNCFRVVGRAFQWCGVMYRNDRWSEQLITRLLLDALVWWEWFILQAKDIILAGNIFLVCLNEKHLTLCLYSSSIFRVPALANSGSVWERRWVPYIILRKHFCSRRILSLSLRLRSSLKFPQFIRQYWRCGRTMVLYKRSNCFVSINLRALPIIPTVWPILVIILPMCFRHEIFLSRCTPRNLLSSTFLIGLPSILIVDWLWEALARPLEASEGPWEGTGIQTDVQIPPVLQDFVSSGSLRSRCPKRLKLAPRRTNPASWRPIPAPRKPNPNSISLTQPPGGLNQYDGRLTQPLRGLSQFQVIRQSLGVQTPPLGGLI